jgi:hypothetical protein
MLRGGATPNRGQPHLHPCRPVEALPKVAPCAAAGERAGPVVGAGCGNVRAVAPQLGCQILVNLLKSGEGEGGTMRVTR